MGLSRKEFLKILGGMVGGWVVTLPTPFEHMARTLDRLGSLGEDQYTFALEDTESHGSETNSQVLRSSSRRVSKADRGFWKREFTYFSESERILKESGYFAKTSPQYFIFDENKYSSPKRKIDPSEWDSTNRHLPIKIDPGVINKPGERSSQALKRVMDYTKFNNPRYVAEPGERVTMCNIAAWDWSRALQLHLPHWIGTTEMSANMLFRWISQPNAGGAYGEGWQPVNANVAQLLAYRGIPVFAMAENPRPGRHGHVALVYPQNPTPQLDDLDAVPYFASVNNGRSHGGNGIKSLNNTFRWLTPTYFVHKHDFIVNQVS